MGTAYLWEQVQERPRYLTSPWGPVQERPRYRSLESSVSQRVQQEWPCFGSLT